MFFLATNLYLVFCYQFNSTELIIAVYCDGNIFIPFQWNSESTNYSASLQLQYNSVREPNYFCSPVPFSLRPRCSGGKIHPGFPLPAPGYFNVIFFLREARGISR